MKTILSITDFRNNISEYINQIVYQNKSFILEKCKKKVACIVPFNKKTDKNKITSLLKARRKLFKDKTYFKDASPNLSQDVDKILYEKK